MRLSKNSDDVVRFVLPNYADLLMIMVRSTGSPFSILTASKRPSGVIQYGMPEMYTNLSLIISPPFTKSKQPVDYTGCLPSVKSLLPVNDGKNCYMSAMGGINAADVSVSQGKSTHVSWLTSVTNVSTRGLPSGFA
jgi:hypothetical protein